MTVLVAFYTMRCFSFFGLKGKIMGRQRKSSKSKEKKLKKKEESAKLAVQLKKIQEANNVEDPMAPFSVFRKYDRNGLNATLETTRADHLVRDVQDWIFNLCKRNMRVLYEQSNWGWSDREKREELVDSRAWHLIARDQDGKPIAFSHFRFDMEDGDEVLYCYELQLEKEAQRKGLGKFMMQILELMAHKYEMVKVMLTTFKHNAPAQAFFIDKMKYETDEISPEVAPFDEEEYSYIILSKRIPHKSTSPSKKAAPAVSDQSISSTEENSLGGDSLLISSTSHLAPP